MSEHKNHLGQNIGFPLPAGRRGRGRRARRSPGASAGSSRSTSPATPPSSLPPTAPTGKAGSGPDLPYGPFASLDAYREFVGGFYLGDDPLFHTIVEAGSGRAVGVASLMRIDPGPGVIEVGGIAYGPALQRTPAATEAMFLLMRRAFDASAIAATNGSATC